MKPQTNTNFIQSGFRQYGQIYWHESGLVGITIEDAKTHSTYHVISIAGEYLYTSQDEIDALWFAIDLIAGAPVPSYRQMRSMINQFGRVQTKEIILKRIIDYMQK